MSIKLNILIIVATLLVTSSFTSNAQHKGFAVLELYTSEGCSSCPTAEALMPKLKEQYGADLYILEFHVDYWNRLGWTDRFSNSEYSDRQRAYTDVFNSNTVYTPQAVINGRHQLVGSRASNLEKIIDIEIAEHKPEKELKIWLEKASNSSLIVNFSSKLSDDEFIYLALVQQEAHTQVRSGENKGKLLKHTNIVRSLDMSFGETGKKTIDIPKDAFLNNCHIIAFVQNSATKAITAVKRAELL